MQTSAHQNKHFYNHGEMRKNANILKFVFKLLFYIQKLKIKYKRKKAQILSALELEKVSSLARIKMFFFLYIFQ